MQKRESDSRRRRDCASAYGKIARKKEALCQAGLGLPSPTDSNTSSRRRAAAIRTRISSRRISDSGQHREAFDDNSSRNLASCPAGAATRTLVLADSYDSSCALPSCSSRVAARSAPASRSATTRSASSTPFRVCAVSRSSVNRSTAEANSASASTFFQCD